MRIGLKHGLHWTGGVIVFCAFACIGDAQAQTNTPPASSPRLPCVVLIVADGLGYGELGCYGQREIRTPRIDAVATNGFRFTNFHAGGGSDSASRAALMTGAARRDGTVANIRTVAERFSAKGYTTGLIGYWGLGGFDSSNAPQRRGFGVVVTYGDRRHSHDLYTGHLYRRDPLTGFEDSIRLAGNPPGRKDRYLPDLLTHAAVKFCKQNKPERLNDYRPFLLVVSYPVPAAADGRGPVPELPAYADNSWSPAQKARANAITRFDGHVGEILDQLALRGMAQNTIVVVTSSLGPDDSSSASEFFDSAGPFAVGDQPLAEGRLRIPLIVEWPFWMKSGRTSDLLLSGSDIVPTLLEAARMDSPGEIDGISFLPTLTGQSQTNRHDHLDWTAVDGEGTTHNAVRRGYWKVVRQGTDQPWRLYDLKADPGEQTDLAGQHPEVVKELQSLLDQGGDTGGGGSRPRSAG